MVAIAPNTRVYSPRGGAEELFRSGTNRIPRIVMDGPAGTGKTRAILEYLVYLAHKYPGIRILIFRETRVSMSESVLVTLEEEVLGPSHYAVLEGGSRDYRRAYVFHNGSTIVTGGFNNEISLYSTQYDVCAGFEAIEMRFDKVQTLLRSMRNGKRIVKGKPLHQLILDTNPGPSTHWINTQANDGWLHRIVSRHKDNGRWFDHAKGEWKVEGVEYIANLDGLQGHNRERLLHGRWVNAEGVVYEEFDQSTHVINTMPKGWESWPKYRAIDFGYNDPFVCQWWAVNDDVRYLYREIYMSRRTVAAHAKQIIDLSKGEEYVATVSDHDREDRATLAEAGIDTEPANKEDILQGINLCKQLLRIEGNGKPRVVLLRDALVEVDSELRRKSRPTCTREEMDAYLWKRNTDGISKDKPEDKDNHGMDAMRYGMMRVSNVGVDYVGVGFAGGETPEVHDDWSDW